VTRRLYQYVTPFIYPLFPAEVGALIVNYSIQNVLTFLTAPNFTGEFTLNLAAYSDGQERSREAVAISVKDGVAEIPNVVRRFQGDGLGYVEVGIVADRPAFTKVMTVQGYGLFVQPGRGSMTFGSDLKFARGPIIEQIARFGMFCMQHTASYVNRSRNIGNSLLLINPYRQPIVARLASSSGRDLRQRVDSHCAVLVPVTKLVEDGKWETVMITANNRTTVFDVRHAYDDPNCLNNIDHIDFMNGWSTHDRRSPLRVARSLARRLGRAAEIYLS